MKRAGVTRFRRIVDEKSSESWSDAIIVTADLHSVVSLSVQSTHTEYFESGWMSRIDLGSDQGVQVAPGNGIVVESGDVGERSVVMNGSGH